MTTQTLRSRPIIILGSGYTGKFLYPLAKAHRWRTYATSRSPATRLDYVDQNDRIIFNLDDEETWDNIPHQAHLIWCFPALPQAKAMHFLNRIGNERGRLILLGSTSAYGAEHRTLVNEDTPVDTSLPRVQSEEYFRNSCGAIVLRLAGLYGPNRHVLDWIRKGKVNNTEKFVNLIHIEDVAAICIAALEKAIDGETYIVSDGIPRQWSEIFTEASIRWNLGAYPPSPAKHAGKRLSIEKLKTRLYSSFLHTDLYRALDEIETCKIHHGQ